MLYIVGLGPGHTDHMSKRAHDVLAEVDTVVGYTTYVESITHLIEGKQVISTAMKKEVDRVEAAIDLAVSGESCALVCSGDPGIYAMAGLVYEMCAVRKIPLVRRGEEDNGSDQQGGDSLLHIEVVPGIPALGSGAALLGAPLTHDFTAISLSDLLTPWELIEQRIEAAGTADFVIAIYNPKSKKRDWQLNRTQEILLKHRDKETVVGIVTSAMRANQRVVLTTLGKLHEAAVDMQTTVFIGNSSSFAYQGYMITPRGYAQKYSL